MDKTNPQQINNSVENVSPENEEVVLIPSELVGKKLNRHDFKVLVNHNWSYERTVKENLDKVVAEWKETEQKNKQAEEDMEEFDKFLEEFLHSEEENTSESESDQTENDSLDAIDYPAFKAKVFAQFADDEHYEVITHKKQTLLEADHPYLLIRMERPLPDTIKFPLTVELTASNQKEKTQLYADVEKLCGENTCGLSVSTQKLFEGIDLSDHQTSVSVSVTFYDLDANMLGYNQYCVYTGTPFDHMLLTKACLCKSIEPYANVELESEYISFDDSSISDLYPYFYFDFKTTNPSEMVDYQCVLRDDKGRFLDLQICDDDYVSSEFGTNGVLEFKFGDFCNYDWQKGYYQLELRWLNELVAKIRFEIGSKDMQGTFDPIAAQDRTGRGACKIVKHVDNALEKLNEMVGLKNVKKVVQSLSKMHRLASLREANGLPVKKIPLHVWFTGRPGTGKTTVARLMGQIYKDMGLLSSGHVVYEERRTLVGRYYDSELRETERALKSAQGGILFIDEAYSLYVKDDDKDPGHKIIESLLTALSDEENRDWMLILAGYPKEMEELMNSNPGLKSRISFRLDFEDYEPNELMGIADLYCTNNQYILTPEARQCLESVVKHDYSLRDGNFGNGRYVINLLEQQVIPNMASRLYAAEAELTKEQLSTIEAEDIPVNSSLPVRDAVSGFDEKAIKVALEKLDALVGLDKVKSSIHNFVELTRYRSIRDHQLPDTSLLRWNFVGNTGTGKSTVAQLLADILTAMGLLSKGNMVELKAEQLYNLPEYQTTELLRTAMAQTQHGLLFIDGDAPAFKTLASDGITNERLLLKLSSLTADSTAKGAIVLAECESPRHSLTDSLAQCGVYDFDHTLVFEDYNAEQLYAILCSCLTDHQVQFANQAGEKMQSYLQHLCDNRNLSFANARTMKLLSDSLLNLVDLRASRNPSTPRDTILYEDVQTFEWRRPSGKLGF